MKTVTRKEPMSDRIRPHGSFHVIQHRMGLQESEREGDRFIIKQGGSGGYDSRTIITAADSGNNVDGFSDLPVTIIIFVVVVVVVFYSASISLSVY
jgi:hypothetical protein